MQRRVETDPGAEVRQPPMNLVAEQSLLGALLLNNSLLERIDDLTADAFFDPFHAHIFEIIVSTVTAGRLASPVTLRHHFENAEPVQPNITAVQYLGTLVARTTATAASVGDYARIIRDLHLRRTLIVVAEDLARDAFVTSIDRPVAYLIEAAEATLYEIAPKQANERTVSSFVDAAEAAISSINDAYGRNGGLAGHATGFPGLDRKTGGLRNGNLVIIAGRPGMGKTALAVNIATNLARAGVPVVFCSLEMSRIELATRILSGDTGLPAWKLATGSISGPDMASLMAAKQQSTQLPLTIDESGGLTVPQIRARARRLKRQGKLDVLIVDYLGLMRSAQTYGGSRVQEVTEITNGLKAIAKELNVPVVALSQLNRAVESRDNKRPQLSDLRDSGSVEQDADLVMFCFREEYYLEQAKPVPSDRAAYSEWLSKV